MLGTLDVSDQQRAGSKKCILEGEILPKIKSLWYFIFALLDLTEQDASTEIQHIQNNDNNYLFINELDSKVLISCLTLNRKNESPCWSSCIFECAFVSLWKEYCDGHTCTDIANLNVYNSPPPLHTPHFSLWFTVNGSFSPCLVSFDLMHITSTFHISKQK